MRLSEQEHQQEFTKNAVFFAGVLFFIAGLVCLIKIEWLQDYMSFDFQTAAIFSGALMFAGASDMVVAKFILFRNINKD